MLLNLHFFYFQECIKPVQVSKKNSKGGAVYVSEDGNYFEKKEVRKIKFTSFYILVLSLKK